ncbi:hypothetical protein SAMN05216389_104209 [Oceanobacillus limi]|uniref:Uncharacterized protein n=1 Tax=Oceanobacillus limi TaxID=930131 RepID=A0A1I0B6Q6_9BACI|nr:hypothetical protein [Oceanobacillus limi]SET02454.1 hypothetical protein SAMN05216389_104209 [Oceanobacillus limi]
MVKAEDLEKFIASSVEVCIHGRDDEDRAPWIKRKIRKVEPCPDATHLRIYFDKRFFVAVPFSSSVVQRETEWKAFDESASLYYVIRSEGK